MMEGTPPHARAFAAKVVALAGFGISAGAIADILGVGEDELRKDYSSELDRSAIKGNARVAESLFRKATGDGHGAVLAAIFWLKTRARWKEKHVHEHASRAVSAANKLAS